MPPSPAIRYPVDKLLGIKSVGSGDCCDVSRGFSLFNGSGSFTHTWAAAECTTVLFCTKIVFTATVADFCLEEVGGTLAETVDTRMNENCYEDTSYTRKLVNRRDGGREKPKKKRARALNPAVKLNPGVLV